MKNLSRPQFRELAVTAGLAALFSLTSAGPTFGCTCSFPRSLPAAALEQAHFVFTGRAIAVRIVDFDLEVRFEVFDVYKGTLGAEVMVITDDSGIGCGFPFQEGTDYLVYGHGSGEQVYTNHCGRTQHLAGAQGDLLALQAARAPLPPTDQLFFTAGGQIHRVSPDGSGLTVLIDPHRSVGLEARALAGLSVSMSGLVWAGQNALYIAGADGSHPGKLANAGEGFQSQRSPMGVSFTEAGLFWTVAGSRPELYTLDVSIPLSRSVTGSPLGITAIEDNLFSSDPEQDAIFIAPARQWWEEPLRLIDLDRFFGEADYHPAGIQTRHHVGKRKPSTLQLA